MQEVSRKNIMINQASWKNKTVYNRFDEENIKINRILQTTITVQQVSRKKTGFPRLKNRCTCFKKRNVNMQQVSCRRNKNITSFSKTYIKINIKFLEEIMHIQQVLRTKISIPHVSQETNILPVSRRKIPWWIRFHERANPHTRSFVTKILN